MIQKSLLFVILILSAVSCAARYPYEKKTADELYADAGVDLQNNDGDAATYKLDYIKDKHPEFPDKEGVDFRYAEAKKAKGKYWKAFVDLREFREKYPVSSRHAKSEELLFDIGTLLLQSTSSFLGTGLAKDADDGVIVLEYLVDNFQNSRLGDEALRRMAQYKYETRDYPGAINDYQRILKSYLGSQWRDLAEFRIALSHLRGVRRPDLDQSELLKAKEALQNYLSTRPEGSRLEEAAAALREANEWLAESEYKIGEYYRVVEEPYAASVHYKNTIINYPGTGFAAKAETRLADMPADIQPPPAKFPVKTAE